VLAGLAGLLLAGLAQAQQAPPTGTPPPPTPWTGTSVPLGTTSPPAAPAPGWQTGGSPRQPVAAPAIRQTALQPGAFEMGRIGTIDTEAAAIQDIAIQLSPPSPDRLFRLESERMLRERLRQEALQRTPPDKIVFPEEVQLTTEPYQPHCWPQLVEVTEPYWVGYEPLFFEQRNAERYGWDLGPIHPLISAGIFLADFVFLPYHAAVDPFRCYEYNRGYCLPGDPTPLRLYPPEMSFTGLVGEAAAVMAVLAIFP
jgi:hypothetical protein